MPAQFPSPPDPSPPDPAPGHPAVAVLLALRDGAATLREQLDSIAGQSHPRWHLLIGEDGSHDDGPAIAAAFATQVPQDVRLLDGPRQGATANFLALIGAAGPRVDYAALADQDDIWAADRLARGLAALSDLPAGMPGLYCSRTWLCDAAGIPRRVSAPRPRPPGFGNALIQNIASGNTMLLNRAALDLAQTTLPLAATVAYHDWWLYQIVSGAGGQVIHDATPSVYYRQHQGNLVGVPSAPRQTRRLWGGGYAAALAAHLAALQAAAAHLSPDNRALLAAFALARAQPLPGRIAALRRTGVYRQSGTGDALFYAAAGLGLI